MPTFSVDFSKIESQDPVPTSNQPVVIDSIEFRQSKSSEHPYLNWKLIISDGPFSGRTLWMITSLAPKALFRLQEVLSALGLPSSEQLDFQVDDATNILIKPPIAGKAAIARVTQETYEGTVRNRVEQLISTGASGNSSEPRPSRRLS